MSIDKLYEESLENTERANEYLRGRGLNSRQDIGYTLYRHKECVVIPIHNSVKELVSLEIREIYNKQYYKSVRPGYSGYLLYGIDNATENTEYVVVCEGVFDSLSLIQNGINSISSLRASVTESVLNLLTLWERIYIAFDNDSVGRDKTERILDFYDRNYPSQEISVIDYYSKDINDALLSGEIRDIVKQIKCFV